MYPTLEQVRTITASGDYRRIPVSREVLADRFTPVEVMRTLRAASRHCYLLESAASDHRWGRYSFLGYSPTLEITCQDGTLRIRRVDEDGVRSETVSRTAHPGQAIREILQRYRSPRLPDMPPFTGGLVGYFAYDYIKYAEPTLHLGGEGQDFRDVDLMLFDKVIVFDHGRQKLILIAGVDAGRPEESYMEAEEELNEMFRLLTSGARADFRPLRLTEELTPCFTREAYCDMVRRAKHYIHEGDIFQVVLSDPLTARAEGSIFNVYRAQRTETPSPYMFYFSSDDVEIAGASPETLMKLEDGVLHTFPLAGPRPRGRTEKEDRRLEAELLAEKKERVEHNMLVDLSRNDIGRISALGSVKVERYMSIERFSHVMHIGSTVSGASARTGMRWTRWTRFSRRAPCPAHPSSGPVRLSRSWRAASAACTAGPSATWTSPATWTPASPSAWPTRKTAASASSPERASWPTACRRRSTRSASTSPGPWSRPSTPHRRD